MLSNELQTVSSDRYDTGFVESLTFVNWRKRLVRFNLINPLGSDLKVGMAIQSTTCAYRSPDVKVWDPRGWYMVQGGVDIQIRGIGEEESVSYTLAHTPLSQRSDVNEVINVTSQEDQRSLLRKLMKAWAQDKPESYYSLSEIVQSSWRLQVSYNSRLCATQSSNKTSVASHLHLVKARSAQGCVSRKCLQSFSSQTKASLQRLLPNYSFFIKTLFQCELTTLPITAYTLAYSVLRLGCNHVPANSNELPWCPEPEFAWLSKPSWNKTHFWKSS